MGREVTGILLGKQGGGHHGTERYPLAPIRAAVERLQRITVCTRPFRAAGPRIEREQVGDRVVVHNYGHGGSGWSLSWGSAARVLALLRGDRLDDVAVIGCGALGLTTALSLQRAGAKVRIFARDLPPQVRSSRATGSWTPDARVALAGAVDAQFAKDWEHMARLSFAEFGRSLSLPGEPVKIVSRYLLADTVPSAALARRVQEDPIGFAHLETRIDDLWPEPVQMPPDESPFAGLYAQCSKLFRFDITAYAKHLLRAFLAGGGIIERHEFASFAEVLSLSQRLIVNCTGYGARALVSDESVVPIRGQIAWMPAQPEVQYSLQWENLNVVARPDGIVVQLGAGGDAAGWNQADETPDLREAEHALEMLRQLQTRSRSPGSR